jgi:hypothetical protein
MDVQPPTKRRFQFTLRTVLVLLLLIACALGFWLQEQRLSKARKLLAAHGLLLEWADLKPGEVRATVVNRVEEESYVLLSIRVEARQAGNLAILEKGKPRVRSSLVPVAGSEGWTGEAHVLVDKVENPGNGSTIKVAMTTRSRTDNRARSTSVERRDDDSWPH